MLHSTPGQLSPFVQTKFATSPIGRPPPPPGPPPLEQLVQCALPRGLAPRAAVVGLLHGAVQVLGGGGGGGGHGGLRGRQGRWSWGERKEPERVRYGRVELLRGDMLCAVRSAQPSAARCRHAKHARTHAPASPLPTCEKLDMMFSCRAARSLSADSSVLVVRRAWGRWGREGQGTEVCNILVR